MATSPLPSPPNGAIAVTHRRVVAYDRSQRVIEIEDHFAGEGTRDLALYWQFPAGTEVHRQEASIRVANGPARASLDFAASTTIEIEIVKGRKEPLGGWFSQTYGRLAPAAMGVVRAKGPLPLHTRTAIRLE